MAGQELDKDLTSLSQSLTIPDELLQKVDRCRLLGGVGKKTSIFMKFDYDCVIYTNDVDPPFEKLLDEWEDILVRYLPELKDEIEIKSYIMKFEIDGYKFDVLPAPNYTGFSQDPMSQAVIIWKKIARERSASNRANVSRSYSSGLSELALQFIKKQSSFIHNLCRLAKFWNCTILFDPYVSGRSSIIEYLAVKAGREEEQAAINSERSMFRAFRRFLECLRKSQQIGTMFLDHYDQDRVLPVEKPYLIDPSNPYNNLLADKDAFLSTLAKCAAETLERLDRCEKNF